MRYSTAMLFDRLDRLADLSITRSRAIVIEGPHADPVQADGDIVAHLPAIIDVAPTTLDLFAPCTADGAAAD
jgi:diacylglycerol kinase family enzyme